MSNAYIDRRYPVKKKVRVPFLPPYGELWTAANAENDQQFSRFAEIWRELMKVPTIPRLMNDRKTVLAPVWRELADYIINYESTRKPRR